jgi:hypothetical protein
MGVQLVAGWNYDVIYGGISQGIEAAIVSIKSKLIIMWVYRGGAWHMYDPLDLIDSDLTYLYNGETCQVNMKEAAYWVWAATVPAQVSGLDVAYVKV